MTNNPQLIVVHHTASPLDTTVASVNAFHRDKDWDNGPAVAKAPVSSLGWYVQYHYFIEKNGKVTQCAQESEVRWHAGPDANTRSIAICLAGWFDDGHDTFPTDAQVKTLSRLVRDIQMRYKFSPDKIHGHRDFMNKTCPGAHITDDWLKGLMLPSVLPPITADPAFAKKFNGTIIVAGEDHGRKWYVYKGKRIEIDKAPEFEKKLSGKEFVTWMNNADLAKIPLM